VTMRTKSGMAAIPNSVEIFLTGPSGSYKMTDQVDPNSPDPGLWLFSWAYNLPYPRGGFTNCHPVAS
jgi:hypothetical protein